MYSRFGNPTVAMFEERMALIEGAPVARATATGMAAVTTALLCHLRQGDHVIASRAMFGGCRYRDRGRAAALRHHLDAWSTARNLEAWRQAVKAEHEGPVPRNAGEPDARNHRPSRRRRNRAQSGRAPDRRQRLRNAGASAPDGIRRRHRRLFRDQTHRRSGPLPRRRRSLCDEKFLADHLLPFIRNTGPSLSPFNAWVLIKALETLDLRVRAMCEHAAAIADALARERKVKRVVYPGRADHPQAALARAQMGLGGSLVTFEIDGGKAGRIPLCQRAQT